MKRTGRKKEWSILVFCAFLVGVFPPILFLFDKPALVLGVPLSFVYLYGLWAVMIGLIAIGARRRRVLALTPETETNRFTEKVEADKKGTDNE